MNIFDIPIYFVNRNRLESLRKMIDWLVGAGFRNIKILDNGSTFPPLIEYYQALPSTVEVIRLQENLGPWAFWKLGLHRQVASDYIVSDSDLVPAVHCPEDLIIFLKEVLIKHPSILKVGAGLNLKNVSPHYSLGEHVQNWEQQFWHKPVGRCLFSAGVDTTFALYRKGSDFTNDASRNLRTGFPYLLEHTPWLVDDRSLPEEEIYYRNCADSSFSFWSSGEPTEKLERLTAGLQMEPKRILHLGCGNEYIPGWMNIDVSGEKLDLAFDLNDCLYSKLPLAENSVDGFYMSHVIEHIQNVLPLMEELYRVGRPGAKMFIRVPHGSSNDAWEDPTHFRSYFESSFVYFSQPAYSRADYGYLGDWQTERITLLLEGHLPDQPLDEILRKIRHERNHVNEMLVELSVVKPPRPRRLDLLKNGNIRVAPSNALIAPDF